ncbi:MAG: 4-hydroxy-tetrahydrodipicolinate synthase [Candidatus Alcyoniella australis]|nr:4-hydroxy-tetrahydrodipicolinate synthase [Candidatus Alcyoniella australis]
MFRGCFVASVTPFQGGAIDMRAFGDHLEWLIDSGVHGLVPCGTTGEAATMSVEEHIDCIKAAVRIVKGRVPVIAGAGANGTVEAVALVQAAKQVGADAALVVTPYYVKPSQQGLYEHFAAVAEQADLPMVLYNVPSRTGVNLLPQTVERLAALPQIVAVKEAGGTIHQTIEIRARAPRLAVLSGDDNLYLPHLAVGAQGIISVLANVAPAPWSQLYEHFAAGRFSEAQRIFLRLFPACKAMFIESNPMPVKAAMVMLGRCGPELRLPLTQISPENHAQLQGVLRECGILDA